MKKIEQRLQRLVETDICQADNVEEYKDELIKLAQEVADIETVKKQSRFFKALADETRLRILSLLEVREMCVCEVMVALEMTQPNASHHLGILENVGLVKRRKEGKWVYYAISDQELIEYIHTFDLR